MRQVNGSNAALLGDMVGSLRAGGVVMSPTSRLHGVPWDCLPGPCREGVDHSSLGSLLDASPGDSRRRPAVPPCSSSGRASPAEVREVLGLKTQIPDAVLLAGGAATVDRTLGQLDGARLVHIAAHGRFRPDSPMFSSLVLDDGPLVVHDFERLSRAPYRVLLSACESGVIKPVGADELLGLGATLLSLGSAGIVSSVAMVDDEATVTVVDWSTASSSAGPGWRMPCSRRGSEPPVIRL